MRKLTPVLSLALSTAALAFTGTATAQTPAAPSAQARAPKPDMTRAQAQARAEAAFARFDANKDGTLDQADRQAMRAKMFERIDADKNGSISPAELEALHAKRGAAGDKAGKGHRMGRKGMRSGHGMMAKAQGPVTRQAFVDRALTAFDKADANRDGTVTSAERKAVRDSMRQQWQAKKAARQQG